MKINFSCLIICALTSFTFFGSRAHAEVLAAIGTNMTFEYAADGRTLQTHQPWSLRGGYRFPQLDLYAEYQDDRSSQGTSMVSVAREHQETLLWAREIFLPDWRIAPYVAGGAGIMWDTVETSFSSEQSRDPGTAQTLLALAGGVRASVWKIIEVDLEGRMAYSQSFNPNPMFGGSLLFGVSF